MLTPLQLSRITFHLGGPVDDTRTPFEAARGFTLANLSPEVELAAVGVVGGPGVVLFEGETLCSPTSALGRCEASWDRLSPSVIEESLFVSSAGEVTLRPHELRNRSELYKATVDSLGRLLGIEVNQGYRGVRRGSGGPSFHAGY